MPLQIDYLPPSGRAALAADGATTTWSKVRRICEEITGEVVNVSATELTVPWWAFLAAWRQIGTLVRVDRERVEVSDRARELLVQAVGRLGAYADASRATPLGPEVVRERLAQAGFERILTDEQARNVGRLAVLPAGASFSVPGAGKSTEALAVYTLRRSPATRLVVVCPKNAFAPWEEQVSACFGDRVPQLVRLEGGRENIAQMLNEAPDIALISYQQLPIVSDLVSSYMTSHPTLMTLDESHRMKGGQGRAIGRAVLSLAHLPESKVILSGTPLPNALADLCPQLQFLYPELSVSEANVRSLIQPVYVRTVKRELGLRDPIRQQILVPLIPGQRRLYELIRSEVVRQATTLRPGDRAQLRAMGRAYMRLLQLVSNPALLASVDLGRVDLLRDAIREGDSPKMHVACAVARDLAARGQKTIIWSSFVENVEVLAGRLADLGADYIHGGVETGENDDGDTREAKIRRFHHDPAAYVLVANPAAASESISLHTVCHHAIYVDRTYNVAHYLQSEDRIHRLGLAPDQETYVYILTAPNTIDDSVARRLEVKSARMAQVLNDPSLDITPAGVGDDILDEDIDEDDIADLLRSLRGE